MIDLIVVAKYELVKFVVEKVDNGQKLNNCANSQFYGGVLPTGREVWNMEGGC